MLTIRGRLITPFVLGFMSVGLNILIRHSFMDLWFWITALVPWPQLLNHLFAVNVQCSSNFITVNDRMFQTLYSILFFKFCFLSTGSFFLKYSRAVWSGSALFKSAILSVTLGYEIYGHLCSRQRTIELWLCQCSFYFRPDYISPLDDLAFDMYQDPEIAQIIRKLERKKQEAVLRMFLILELSLTCFVFLFIEL